MALKFLQKLFGIFDKVDCHQRQKVNLLTSLHLNSNRESQVKETHEAINPFK